MTHDKTDAMINTLCDDLKPASPPAPGWLVTLLLTTLTLVYCAVVSLWVGLRPDLDARLGDMAFRFELMLTLVMGISALMAACRLRAPDADCDMGGVAIQTVPLTMLAVLVGWFGLRLIDEDFAWIVEPNWWRTCFVEAFAVGFLPVVATILTLKSGRTVSPARQMGFAMLGAAALGWVFLRLTCGVDAVSHSFCVLYLPFILAGLVAAMLARRVFRW